MFKIENLIPIISNIKKKVSEVSAGKIIYLTVSGAHLYGFPSYNSDIDIRGSYAANPSFFLGIHSCKDTITSIDPDFQLFELKKLINLAIKGNCNVLEHIFSNPIYKTPEYFRLKELIQNILAKDGIYNSYRGMASFNYKKFILGGKATYKKYLYVFRGLLAARYFLETGRIEPNLAKLNKVYKIKEISTLIKAKMDREEESVAKEIDSGKLDELIHYCYYKLDNAYNKSSIPAKPDKRDIKKLNSFLIKLRKDML